MEKLTYKVKEIAPHIWSVDEYSMNYMYIIEGRERSLVIDTGTGTGDFKGLIERITPLPYDVVCTHGHVDHCGGIGQFPRIYMHPGDIPDITRPDGTISVANRKRYSARGFALNNPAHLPFTLDTFEPIDTSPIEFVPIFEGHQFLLGGRTLEVYETPGHSKGCICLLLREDRILFAGDSIARVLILPLPGAHRTRIAMWLKGMEKMEQLLPYYNAVYTGHQCPIDTQIFLDQLTLARGILTGKYNETYLDVDEYAGFLYHYGGAYFTLREENLATRDYKRMLKN